MSLDLCSVGKLVRCFFKERYVIDLHLTGSISENI